MKFMTRYVIIPHFPPAKRMNKISVLASISFSNTTVTNISLILSVLLNALQLAAGARGLFFQGATAVVHGCSVHALDPSSESLYCRRGVSWSSPMPITKSLALSTLWSTLVKGHKQAAFHVRFIEKLVWEVRVVSQQYSGMQHTSPNTWL